MTPRAKKSWIPYLTVAGLFALILSWWIIFFAREGDVLIERLNASGIDLTVEEMDAVRGATHRSLVMFASEGGVLVVLLFAGLLVLIRAQRREVEMHRRQRDFLSAVTHELRSPIASARLQVESLRMGRVPEGKQERYLVRTLADMDRLSRTVDQLLKAARTSSGRIQLNLQDLDLADFTRRIVTRIGHSDPSLPPIALHAPREVHVHADSDALGTIIENLVSNALKYGGSPPQVEVTVDALDREARIEVADQGPGLDGRIGSHAFDPFVRGGGELVSKRPGIGLGLYLVAELTRALGGSVRARNREGGGLVVSVFLPLRSNAEGGVLS